MQPESLSDLHLLMQQLRERQALNEALHQLHVERARVHICECRRFLAALEQHERVLYRYLVGGSMPWIGPM